MDFKAQQGRLRTQQEKACQDSTLRKDARLPCATTTRSHRVLHKLVELSWKAIQHRGVESNIQRAGLRNSTQRSFTQYQMHRKATSMGHPAQMC